MRFYDASFQIIPFPDACVLKQNDFKIWWKVIWMDTTVIWLVMQKTLSRLCTVSTMFWNAHCVDYHILWLNCMLWHKNCTNEQTEIKIFFFSFLFIGLINKSIQLPAWNAHSTLPVSIDSNHFVPYMTFDKSNRFIGEIHRSVFA